MKTQIDNLDNSHRPLQMVHGFDQWPDTSDNGLRTRIRGLISAGLGGLVANVSFKNYLRDEKAWDLLHRGVRIAHEEGLRVWIYDEEGYPSGTAGGLVLEKVPSAEAQGLIRVVDPVGRIHYEVITLYEATHATENFYKKRHYINILDPLAVATFLKVTHDQYARVLNPIGQYVEAFFTDEPSLIPAYIPKGRDYPQTLPWHPRLPEEFRKRKGYDLLPYRESLFVDTGDIDRKIRCDFYEVVADLCAETYFGGLQQWCHDHHVAASGHLLGEETLVWQTDFDGDPFTCYRRFDIPGIDMITSDPEKILTKEYFMVPKVAGSSARLQGKQRVMCEISDFFGIMDKHHASMDQMKCTAGILYSFGVTDLCSYYTLSFAPESETKPNEFPVPEYRKYTEFTSRLNAVFTGGTVAPRVAVLYPMVAFWSHFTPSHRSMYEDHPNPDVRLLDTSFTNLCRSLLQQQIDYDIIDERTFATAGVDADTLAIGGRRYRLLVLPDMDTIRVRTMETILKFVDAKGSVLAHALLPKHAAEGPEYDTHIAGMVERLCAAGALGGCQPGAPPLGYLVKSRVLPDCDIAPSSSSILCTALQRKQGAAYFFVNVSSKEYDGACIFRGGSDARLFDPSTGDEQPLPVEKTSDARSRISLKLRPFESLFVMFRQA